MRISLKSTYRADSVAALAFICVNQNAGRPYSFPISTSMLEIRGSVKMDT